MTILPTNAAAIAARAAATSALQARKEFDDDVAKDFKDGQPRSRTQAFMKALRTPYGHDATTGADNPWYAPRIDFMVAALGAVAIIAFAAMMSSLVVAVGAVAFGTGSGTLALGAAAVIGKGLGVAGLAAPIVVGVGMTVAKMTGQDFFATKNAATISLNNGIDKAAGKVFDDLKSRGVSMGKVPASDVKLELANLYKDLAKRADEFPAADKADYMGKLDTKFKSWGIEPNGGSMTNIKGFLDNVRTAPVAGDFNSVVNDVLVKMTAADIKTQAGNPVAQGDIQHALLTELSGSRNMKQLLRDADPEFSDVVQAGLRAGGAGFDVWLTQPSSVADVAGGGGAMLTNGEVLGDIMAEPLLANITIGGVSQERMAKRVAGDSSLSDDLAANRANGRDAGLILG